MIAEGVKKDFRERDNISINSRAWAEVNLKNLHHNVVELQRILPRTCEIMAVVKADAYGHGSVQVSRYLNQVGVLNFAVATLEEGIELRERGIKGNILILGYTNPKDIQWVIRYQLIQTVLDYEYAKKLNQYNKKVKVHVKLDTGMGRLGEEIKNIENIINIYRCRYLDVCGTFTHLSVSDSLEPSDIAYTDQQINSFYKVIGTLKLKKISPGKIHIQSSYGVLNRPELNCDYARIGIALYGALDYENIKVKVNLCPVLSLKSRVVAIKNIKRGQEIGYGRNYIAKRDGKIGIISIGYADGIPRTVARQGIYCLINGSRAPIIGNVCMDQLIVDITKIGNVKPDDIAIFIGESENERITVAQVAQRYDTISNEILSRIGHRIKTAHLLM